MRKKITAAISLLVFSSCAQTGASGVDGTKTKLFISRPFSARNEFTVGIEGPAVDSEGNVYAVNFGRKGTVGIVSSEGQAKNYIDLPKGSVGNSIAISASGKMYVADYVGHKIFIVDRQTKKIQTYVESVGMSQPNDMALSKEDVLYLTDPNWTKKSGRIWRVAHGQAEVIYEGPHVYNGIDLSSDEKSLYLE